MRERLIDLHADWLGLVEPEGQFLTLPVLRRAFPAGLDTVPPAVREQIRDRYPHGAAPTQAQWDNWIDWLFREALSWGPYYRTDKDAAVYAHAMPEYDVTLRADALLTDTKTDRARVLIVRYPHGTALERRLAGERWNASPIDRLTLLCRANSIRIGLATDGERVVLVWVPPSGVGGYATWDTALFTEGRERNLLQSFLSLLHASRFFAVRGDAQLEALFESSEKAQNEVTGQLGLQVRQAVELLVTALSRSDLDRGGALLVGVAPRIVYEAAATVMMRLVFLLYAEERDLLPMADPFYAEYYAASTLREQLDAQAAVEGDEPLERRGAAWFRLLALFRVIYAGLSHDRLRLPPYGGRLFDPDRFPFLEGRGDDDSWASVSSRPLPVDDLTVRAILEAIQTLPIREAGSRERRRLSFRSLDVEQIGHVYEGLLDHGAIRVDRIYVGLVGKTGDEAELPLEDLETAATKGPGVLALLLQELTGKGPSAIESMIERGRRVAEGVDIEARRLVNTVCDNDPNLASRVFPFFYALRTDLHGLPVVFPAQSLVVKYMRARRESGTEYTPREVAEETVRYALEPLVYSPGPKDGADPAEWRLRAATDLLDLKICDPAVGSGAFLVSACRYLADRVVEAWVIESSERKQTSYDELTLEARRAVVDRCLYGVDRDSMAVEMAKLSLWLVTMAHERPFSFLDHSIREGDSLLGITSLEQLRFLHIDPTHGKALHSKTLIDITTVIQPVVDEATALRRQLESLPNITVRNSEEKKRLNEQANRVLEIASVIADGVVATALFTSTSNEQKRNSAFQGLASLVASALDEHQSVDKRIAALDRLRSRNEQMLNAGRPEDGPPRATLHWAFAFPEVLSRASHGFDAIVGNPPFMGAKKVSLALGSDFREYLVTYIANGKKGNADLVSYFFLRAATLSRSFAFLAINTIAQGDTREVGLDELVRGGWRIVRAVKTRPWPGVAGVHIAQVWLSQDETSLIPVLDGVPVAAISPLLSPASRRAGNPYRLTVNAGVAFQGSVALGMGFIMTPDDAREHLVSDPRNADVLFPFLNAEDLCSRPDVSPSRWIIDFRNRSLDEARRYPELFLRVEQLVKPERDKKRQPGYVKYWWRFAHTAETLYEKISCLSEVIVFPRHSKVVLPVMCSTGKVFSDALAVVASSDHCLFGALTSTLHREWVRRHGSSLESRTRYTPTDCFETFPFPTNSSKVAELGRALTTLRTRLMLEGDLGLTALYNQVHDPEMNAPTIIDLRELHRQLDEAVCEAYGWSDLQLGYGFIETDEGRRWTMSDAARSELLDRLLELNYERHLAELASRVIGDEEGRSSVLPTRKRGKRFAHSNEQPSLLV